MFGAATGTGKLLALDERQMVWALGTAATQSAGLCECLGTPAKSVSVGNAARNGLWSALLAEKGFDGPGEPLAGAQGFYQALAAHVVEPVEPAILTHPLILPGVKLNQIEVFETGTLQTAVDKLFNVNWWIGFLQRELRTGGPFR